MNVPFRFCQISFLAVLLMAGNVLVIHSQRLAVLTPDHGAMDEKFAGILSEPLSKNSTVADASLADTAFRSLNLSTPFNLTLTDAKTAASVIGCDHFVILRTGLTRRESFAKGTYFEAYAVLHVVSGRTGRLVKWIIKSVEGASSEKAATGLTDSMSQTATEIRDVLAETRKSELREETAAVIMDVPPEGSAEAVGLRTPIPYKRLKPEYTTTAYLYDVRATVDIEVDIDANSRITRTNIVRWAGYGLDESVIEAVMRMNWRPAERSGKPLAMRVLLRYNFKRLEKD